MVCPYAKQIRGSIAFCQLIRRKVSTLRYPCKGDYKRCPVYQRFGAKPAPAPKREKPKAKAKPLEEPVEPVETSPVKRAEAGEAGSVQSAHAEKTEAGGGGLGVFKPSKSLCDSLVLASLTVASQPLGIARGRLEEVINGARRLLNKDSIVFILGDIGEYRMRILFAGNLVTYSFEKAGIQICGEEAREVLEKVKSLEFNGIYYRVKLDDIPLWRDDILKELGAA